MLAEAFLDINGSSIDPSDPSDPQICIPWFTIAVLTHTHALFSCRLSSPTAPPPLQAPCAC